MSRESKKRLDEAVFLASSKLCESPEQMQSLHFGRPEKFANYVLKHILVYRSVNAGLKPDDLSTMSPDFRLKAVESSLRRLVRRHRLEKTTISVPVLKKTRGGGKINEKDMIVYKPTTILDKIAKA